MTALYVPLLLALAITSALFSATETALFSLGRGTLGRWRANGSRWQQLAARLMDDHHGALIAILLGNNFVNILVAVVLARLTATWATGALASVLAGLAATGVLLVFGEVIPKTLAYNQAGRLAPWLARLLYPLYRVLQRLGAVAALKYASGTLLRLLSRDKSAPAVSVEEYQTYIQLGRTVGIFDSDEADLLGHALRLREVTAGQAMTPRTEVDWVPIDLSERDLARRVRRIRHRLVPVAQDGLDNVVGILAVQPFLTAPPAMQADWRHTFVQRPLYLPESTALTTVLDRMRQEGQRLALVVDEYGGVEGLLTLEDIIEEMIGEMEDEYDEPGKAVVRLADGQWEAGGTTRVSDLARAIPELPLPETAADTVGGLLGDVLGHMPRPGDRWEAPGWRIVVRLANRRRVTAVEILRDEAEDTP